MWARMHQSGDATVLQFDTFNGGCRRLVSSINPILISKYDKVVKCKRCMPILLVSLKSAHDGTGETYDQEGSVEESVDASTDRI
jgi:hypothetical protein